MKQTHTPVFPVILVISLLPALPIRAQGKFPKGLLLPPGKVSQGTFRLTDAKGGIWGIHPQYGFIRKSTNNIYGNGMYLHVQKRTFRSSGTGVLSNNGEEIQIGPWKYQDLTVYRRIKIFRKEGLARWLEIIHNNGPARQINVFLRTHMNYGIGSFTTNSGKSVFGLNDFAYITRSNNNTAPVTLHVVCGPKSKLHPKVHQHGNRYDVNYTFTLPAGQTAILANFEAQRPPSAKPESLIKGFRPRNYLRDLPAPVRRLIVNARVSGGIDDMELDREEHIDRVLLRDGQEFLGEIGTPEFHMTTGSGPLTLPAWRVVGMVAWGDEPGRMRALLKDGQVVSGSVGDQTLRIDIPTVGTQVIPLEDIHRWSYRISKDRPGELTYAGPYLRLRTGDRLSFDAASVPFRLRTRDGVVKLEPSSVLSIRLDNEKHSLHRVVFRNGSELSGLLLPESIEPKLQLGTKQTLPRELLLKVEFAAEEDEPVDAPKLTLANGDVLRGQFDRKDVVLKGKYGALTLQTGNIRTLQSVPDRTGWFRATLWNGSTVQGTLESPRLRFQIQPGPAVEISSARIDSFDQPNVSPPKEVIRGVAELIVQLGAESYKDRKSAQDKLLQMGPGIAPILKKHLENKDPEIRQRIKDILEQLSAVG